MMISTQDLAKARHAWGNGLIAISQAFHHGGVDKARAQAQAFLDATYGYQRGPVLFKPTLASGTQSFRPTPEGALAYLIGHNDAYPLDQGFALTRWRGMDSVTSTSFIEGNIAMWMGWVTLTDHDGAVTKVEKTFGYQKDEQGTLRIILHHSSLPYQP